MILRRFMKHVTDQNWFAVGLDVIVVIVGIFLGLQVQTFYEERTVRKQEESYLNQLHEEVIVVRTEVKRRIRRLNTRLENLNFLLKNFDEKSNLLELTNTHCNEVVYSFRIPNTINSLPTITEIISSGQLNIIGDKKLKLLISNYERDNEQNNIGRNFADSLVVHLVQKYPEMIKMGPPIKTNGILTATGINQCNFLEMSTSQAMINDITSNLNTIIFLTAQFPEQLEILNELHDQLDDLLNVSHQEDI